MRRRTILFLACLALVALAAGGAGWFLWTSAPERLDELLEDTLTRTLGTRVSIAATHLPSDWPPAIEARDVRAGSSAMGPALVVPEARLELDLVGLASGKLQARRLLLRDPRLRVLRAADGSLQSPFGASEEAEEEVATAYEVGRQALEAVVAWLLDQRLPTRRLDIVQGHLTILEEGPDGALPVLALSELNAHVTRNRSGDAGAVRFETGWIAGDDAEQAGRIAGWAELDRVGESGFGLELEDLDLAPLAPVLAGLHPQLEVAGQATGDLELRLAPDRSHRIDAQLELADLRARFPGGQVVRSPSAAVDASIVLDEDRLELWSGEVESDGLRLGVEGTLELPVRDEARLRLALRLPRLSLAEANRAIRWLPPNARDGAREGLERIESGTLRDLEAILTTRLGTFSDREATPLPRLLSDLELSGRLEAANLLLAEEQRLEAAAFDWHYDRGRLDVRGMKGRFENDPLPRLDLTISGLTQLIPTDQLQCAKPSVVPPIPGRLALTDWVRARRRPGSPRSWSRLDVNAKWVAHPILLCVVENLSASLIPADNGWDAEVQQGTWAGAPVHGKASFRSQPGEALRISLHLGPPWEPVGSRDPEGPWAAGSFETRASSFGPWRVRGMRGAFEMSGTDLNLEAVHVDLEPRAEIQGKLVLELGSRQEVPYRTTFRMENGSASHVLRSLGVEGDFVDGTLVSAGTIEGTLHDAASPLANAHGRGVVLARDGLLYKRVPALLAIAMASDALSSLSDRERIPYTAIDADLELKDGILYSRSLSLDGPWIRAVAHGSVNMVDSPNPLEAVMGIFLFRGLDNVISKVPILSRLLLGEDENLINAYFALTGPFGDPDARLIPVKTIATGPASFVLEGFPAFVRGSLSRLRSVLAPGRGAPSVPNPDRRADS
jgi:hypothetical protein